ncbi:glycine cleavage system protein GcvH [Parafrigoribacterium mesophilum]|uniref:glycine cleavage system protein GcvH n=1 Tax=Parafrigoribacterium mesophilum TaxID=433646 RepID=UPI0031FD50AB
MADKTQFRYTPEHEWLQIDGDTATVGITDYAAEKLGDVVFVELPAVGTSVSAGAVIGEIESTKSVGELFSPVDGTVAETNDAVAAAPELINTDPFGEGWMVKITASRPADLGGPTFLTYDGYTALVGE